MRLGNKVLRTGILVLAACAGLAVLAHAALAQESNLTVIGQDVYKVTYFDVATSATASRAGYGGPGSSGGAGDNTVRIYNSTQANGTICALIYVFDDFEELQACCGCPVTPDGLRTLSTVNDLTTNFGVNKADLAAGVISVLSTETNFNGSSTSSSNPNPMGTDGCAFLPSPPFPPHTLNAACFLTTSKGCDPAGDAATDSRTTKPLKLASGIRAYITHDELNEPGPVAAAGGRSAVQGASVDEFQDSPLDDTQEDNLGSLCAATIKNSSGTGVCTCGAGENAVANGATSGR